MNSRPDIKLSKECERRLRLYGENHEGVGWPNADAVPVMYRVMLDVIKESRPIDLLDFGCGIAGLWTYMKKMGIKHNYTGIDISETYIKICKRKYPKLSFICADFFETEIPIFDYAVVNGIFTGKVESTYEEVWGCMVEIISKLFSHANKGVAFNVMSKLVDWEEDYLFHVPLPEMTEFISSLTHNFLIRHDYGFYQYTVYLYK